MTRRCNECTLCCRVLPVAEISKPAGTPCSQQRSKGCRIYGKPSYPRACRLWSCAWLANDAIALPRPDHAGYVVDIALDFITIEGVKVSVVQIWVDPRRPDAHREPMLFRWLKERWDKDEQIGLVRFDSYRAHVLLPPAVTGEGWIESACGAGSRVVEQHTPAEIEATMLELRRRSGK